MRHSKDLIFLFRVNHTSKHFKNLTLVSNINVLVQCTYHPSCKSFLEPRGTEINHLEIKKRAKNVFLAYAS
jgi:hypothetical protein